MEHFGILDIFDEVVGATFDGRIDTKEEAVSYTHLDVYKRQLVYRLERIEKAIGLDIRTFDDAMIFKIATMRCV